jgi:hypothetical protein
MDKSWDNVLRLAREVEAALARGDGPDSDLVLRLAHAIIDHERQTGGSPDMKKQRS